MRTIEIEGKRYPWREIPEMRREQKKAARQPQMTLFELRIDTRPAPTQTAERRYAEPTLFKV